MSRRRLSAAAATRSRPGPPRRAARSTLRSALPATRSTRASRRSSTPAVAALEPSDATAGVEDLLLARVERVAGSADLSVDLAALRGGPGRERVAAVADNRRLDVVGVDPLLHWFLLVSRTGSPTRGRMSRPGREPEPTAHYVSRSARSQTGWISSASCARSGRGTRGWTASCAAA